MIITLVMAPLFCVDLDMACRWFIYCFRADRKANNGQEGNSAYGQKAKRWVVILYPPSLLKLLFMGGAWGALIVCVCCKGWKQAFLPAMDERESIVLDLHRPPGTSLE